jgi:hypothetical protein
MYALTVPSGLVGGVSRQMCFATGFALARLAASFAVAGGGRTRLGSAGWAAQRPVVRMSASDGSRRMFTVPRQGVGEANVTSLRARLHAENVCVRMRVDPRLRARDGSIRSGIT